MKITKESNKLMSFFIKHNCLIPLKQTNKTDAILKNIFKEIKNGVSYVDHIKETMGDDFYNLKIERLTDVRKIPKPKTFLSTAFPEEIIKHIDKHSMGLLTYTFDIFDRNIQIIFLTEDGNTKTLIETYNKYVERIVLIKTESNNYECTKMRYYNILITYLNLRFNVISYGIILHRNLGI